MAKVKDPNWKAPRNAWGHPDLEGTFTSDDFRMLYRALLTWMHLGRSVAPRSPVD